jgi:Tol biopolymer transport system component
LTLAPGARLGPYEILGPLGAGGMGEVYRARDVNLRREVAVKVLPHAFSADADRVARFEREARVLASLNHPHIAAIHGFEASGDVRALVLELVEGPTLADRLRTGPLRIPEALELARQIADALEVAHDKGIVHRDLKPANVKLTPDGSVKVLDFGLAKALDPAPTSDVADSPTLTAMGTSAGVILGTAAYMSPEQARGQVVDKRTDIWAFGCVLYEMLAGRAPFSGATVSDLIAAILGREPDWTALPGGTPTGIRRLLRRCLDKDTKRRVHDIGDARIEIEDAIAAPAGVERSESPAPRVRVPPAVWIASAIVLVIVGIGLFKMARTADVPPSHVRVHQLTALAGLEEAPALSPDGKSVAFTAAVGSKRQVFVRLLAGGPPLQVSRDPAADHLYPRWSRDSSSIVYFSPAAPGEIQGTLWNVPALGGAARRVGTSMGGVDINASDGRLAFFRLSEKRIQLVTAPPDGSSGTVAATFEPVMYYLYPRWSPDGKWIAFQRGEPPLRFDVVIVPSGGGDPHQVTRENNVINGFSWLPDSTGILYSSSRGNTMPYLAASGLWRIALRDGVPQQVTSGETSYSHPDVAPDGAIVAARMRLQSDIWKFPADGRPDENVRRGVRLTHQTGQVLTPTAAPTDTEVAFLSDSGGHANLWVINLTRGELRQITHERDPTIAVGLPVWSPDGRNIAFVGSRGNRGLTLGVWLVDPDGSNLRQVANPALGPAWSRDGRWLYYSTRGGTTGAGADVMLRKIPVDGGAPVTVRTEQLRNVIGVHGSTLYYIFERSLVDGTPDFEIHAASPENAPSRVLARISAARVPLWQIVNPALSPDGKWLAQPLTDGFTTNIWALSTTTAEWRQITDFGERPTFIARRVSWSADGKSILAAVGEGDADIVLLEGLLNNRR